MPNRGLRKDLAIILILFVLPILFFWSVTLGGKTLLPADNAFAWEPWKSYAGQAGVGVPHNSLLSDLYLENYAWKRFIVRSLAARQLPLWNPYILAGVPFLAAGQHSALYPLSALYYILPLPAAYGWFAALHLFLAGLFTYYLARTLRLSRSSSFVAAIAFMFSGLMVTHNVFPMIVAAAVWLPLILACIERIVSRAEDSVSTALCAANPRTGANTQVPHTIVGYLPDMLCGAVAVGMVFLAGHPEMYYYVALTSGAYTLWRLGRVALRTRCWSGLARAALLLAALAIVGLGLGSAQWLPLLETVRDNFREGAASFKEVLGWAYPPRRAIALLIPDFFGNPAHHTYYDIFTRRVLPVTVNALGKPTDSIYWGIKNYVEGACYVGTLPTLLALGALLRRRGRHLWFFALLALFALLFAFGSPLYMLVYSLPGLSQVHSPFRWIFPYTLCVAILAGMGAESLAWVRDVPRGGGVTPPPRGWRRWADRLAGSFLPWLALAGGVGLLGALAGSLLLKERVAALAGRLMEQLAKAPEAFADGRMFYSYEFRNLLIFSVALTASGVVLLLRRANAPGESGAASRSMPRRAGAPGSARPGASWIPAAHAVTGLWRRAAFWAAPASLVILGELFIIGRPFFSAVDPALVRYRTPAIEFLERDTGLYRVISFGSDKIMNANTPMLYDIADVRGYDSIIPRQYVDTMRLIQDQGLLPYNRIDGISARHPEALDSPLLDMLNVKYVLAGPQARITNEGYTLVYDGELRIYRNDSALPRAFLAPGARTIADPDERARALRTFDPRQVVILEETVEQKPAPTGFTAQVEAVDYGANEITITVNASHPCFLVLGDSYAPGWLAFIRPPEVPDPSQAEQRLRIYRANGNFRAVEAPAGRSIVRFKYSPDAVKYGFYGSFLAGVILGLGALGWGWLRFYRQPQNESAMQRVTKNSIAPITLSLINKGIDMAFAMLMLRILGPADAGQFYYAVVVISWFDIITNFGLNTLLTREVAKDKEHANRYLANTTILRLGLCLASAPILGLFFLLRRASGPLDPRTVLAIALFGVSLVPSNIYAGFGAAFNAYERMEVPAFVTTLTTVLKVALGALALIAGAGYVGLAAVSIAVNLGTMLILYELLRRTLFRPHLEVDWGFQKRMLATSYPLMINHLLATLFFKVAVLLLERLSHDPRVLGYYSTAYKYVDAVGVIPAYFTMAIFPLMSRYAANSRGALLKAYLLAIKLLLIIAVPAALLASAFSHELITILGGSQYLPHAADILGVMIWYMPFGFINSVTQYVLIALDQQRFLTRAFAIGLVFNVLANLLLISLYGFMASAYVAVISELVLLVPFYIGIRRHLAPIPWLQLIWKETASALPMAALFIIFPHRHRPLTLLAGIILYLAGLALFHVLDREERETVHKVFPLERLVARVAGVLGRRVQEDRIDPTARP